MGTPAEIADAVWTAGTRTLQAGTADPPASRAEEIADAIWTYGTRTVNGGSPPGAAFPRWRSVRR